VLNTMSRRYQYERMTAEQFSKALNQLNLTMRQFVRLSGVSEAKVERFISGKEDIPHFVTVLCALLTLPNALAMAKGVSDAMVLPEKDDE
jgi:transcriptional regulator with XRE-family HTH domain